MPPQPEPLTDADVDKATVPQLLTLVQALTGVGRQPDQAIDDLARAVDILRAEYHAQQMRAVGNGTWAAGAPFIVNRPDDPGGT
jgi:hypothetical protein